MLFLFDALARAQHGPAKFSQIDAYVADLLKSACKTWAPNPNGRLQPRERAGGKRRWQRFAVEEIALNHPWAVITI